MRIGYVTMRYPLESETFVTNDLRALSALGEQVTLMALRRSATRQDLLTQRGVEHVPVITAEQLSRLGWREALRRPLQVASLLAWVVAINALRPKALLAAAWLFPVALGAYRVAEEQGLDVVHLRWGHHPALVGAMLLRWRPRTVVSLSLSAYDLEQVVPLSRWLARRASVVRTIAKANVPDIVARYRRPAETIDVIVNGVPDEVLDAPLEDRSPGLVITAGRLVASKRFDDVLRAFAWARSRLGADVAQQVYLEVLGDGPERRRLEALADELGIACWVVFRGMVPYAEVVSSMRRAQVMVFLSAKTSERLPNVIKEALAVGCPVIASDTPGIEELISNGSSGYIVSANAPAEAGSALVRMLADSDMAKSMGEVGRRSMQQDFRLSTSARALVSAWSRAAEGVDASGR
jgi:glycosyltransferase involved in cell wall biosynthesis